jgi:hypothetical protein
MQTVGCAVDPTRWLQVCMGVRGVTGSQAVVLSKGKRELPGKEKAWVPKTWWRGGVSKGGRLSAARSAWEG